MAVTQKSVKMLHPDGGANFSHSGIEFEMDEDGFIDIPSALVVDAKAHGYKELSEIEKRALANVPPPKPDAEKMRRSDLLAYADKYDLDISEIRSPTDLRALVAAHIEGGNVPTTDADEDGDEDTKTKTKPKAKAKG